MGLFGKRKSYVAPEPSIVDTARIDTGYYGVESTRARNAAAALHKKNELPAIPIQSTTAKRAPVRRIPPPVSPDTPFHQSTKSLSSDFLYVTSESSYTSSESEKHTTTANRHPRSHFQRTSPPPTDYPYAGDSQSQRYANNLRTKLLVHQQPPATPQQHHVTYPSSYPPPPPSDTSLEYTSTLSAQLPNLIATNRQQHVPPMAHYSNQTQLQSDPKWQPSPYQHQGTSSVAPSDSGNDAASASYESSECSSNANKLHPYYNEWKEYYVKLAAMNNAQQQQQQQQQQRRATPVNNRHSMYVGEASRQQQHELSCELLQPTPSIPQQQLPAALDVQKQRKRHSIASMASSTSSRVPLFVMKSSAVTNDTSVQSFALKQEIPHSNSQYSFAPSPKPRPQESSTRSYLSSYSAKQGGEETDNELILKSRKSVLRSSRYPSEPMSVHLRNLVSIKQNRISSFGGTYSSNTSNRNVPTNFDSRPYEPQHLDDDFDFHSSNRGASEQDDFTGSELDYGSDEEDDILVPLDPVAKLHEEIKVTEKQEDLEATTGDINNSFSSESEVTFAVNTNLQSRSASRKENAGNTVIEASTKEDDMSEFTKKLEELDMQPIRKPSKQISDYSKFLFDDEESEDETVEAGPTQEKDAAKQLMTPETYKGDIFDQQPDIADDSSIQSNSSRKLFVKKPIEETETYMSNTRPGMCSNISLSEMSPPKSPPQVDSLDSSEMSSEINSKLTSDNTLDPRKNMSLLVYGVPTHMNSIQGELPHMQQPPIFGQNMFGSPTPSLFGDSASTTGNQQMQMQMMMQMMQMMNPMFNQMQMMNPMMYEMMKNQSHNGTTAMNPEMLQLMYNNMNMQRDMDNRRLMFPQMSSLMPNLAREHRFSMIGLNSGFNGGSSPGTSPVRKQPVTKDQEISHKIEEFIKLRQVIASGNKSLEYRLKWIKMLISATNYKLYQLINIKGNSIRPEESAQSKQLFIKSSINHLVKLVKDDNLKDDSIRSECYYLYALLYNQDYVETFGEDFGFEKDIPQAIEWYTKCLNLYSNDYKSLYKLGEIFEYEDTTGMNLEGTQSNTDKSVQSFDMALDYYKQSAKFGYNRAIYKISLLYLNAPAIRSTKFFRYFHDLANIKVEEIRLDGDDKEELVEIIGLSCFQLGRIYEGIYPGDLTLEDDFIKDCLKIAPVNYAKSLSYYNKSAKSGCLLAQVRLGYIYEYGELDRKKNASKSVKWYIKATSSSLKFRRSPKAMLGLARWCMVGTDGISRHIPNEDRGKAITWIDRAIEEFDDADAYYMKGELCEQGIIHEDATKYYQLAYQRGHQIAGDKI